MMVDIQVQVGNLFVLATYTKQVGIVKYVERKIRQPGMRNIVDMTFSARGLYMAGMFRDASDVRQSRAGFQRRYCRIQAIVSPTFLEASLYTINHYTIGFVR